MKNFLLTIIALASVVPMWAQGTASDQILLSKEKRGDNVVERYLVRNAESDQVAFEIMFPINISQVQSSFSTNVDVLTALDRFCEQVATDSTMHISAIKVVGYASPDGIESKNMTLATARAKAVVAFLKSDYPQMTATTDAKVFSWADCIPEVNNMTMQGKKDIVAILGSTTHTEAQKEAELKHDKQAWQIFKSNILPPMRHAVVHIMYSVDKVIEKVIKVEQPKPAPAPTATTPQPKPEEQKVYPVGIVETDETGIIVEVPQKESHHKRKKH